VLFRPLLRIQLTAPDKPASVHAALVIATGVIIYYVPARFRCLRAVGLEYADLTAQLYHNILWSFRLTPLHPCATIRAIIRSSSGGFPASPFGKRRTRRKPLRKDDMQYLPGFTVQCINPLCEARGQWLRADATRPFGIEGICPCCGDSVRNVPPPLGPRFRMRPRPLTARPPLRPRPR
jgi:hypothetical protein